jgi:hypothetical protein
LCRIIGAAFPGWLTQVYLKKKMLGVVTLYINKEQSQATKEKANN